MPKAILHVSNVHAKNMWLHCQRLLKTPCSDRDHHLIASTIEALGMVQLDSIGVLARAHDHILWSRHTSYRNSDFHSLSREKRQVFEHFSHDAVILPIATWPYWQRQLKRVSEHRYQLWARHLGSPADLQHFVEQIDKNGPMCSQDFSVKSNKPSAASPKSWSRPPHKLALDYLWLAGTLSVSHRQGFVKYYDLTDRVVPSRVASVQVSDAQQIDWLCRCALQRLGFATPIEIRNFFDACTLAEVQNWLVENSYQLQQVKIESASGSFTNAFAFNDIESTLASLPTATGRLRVVNPFDPITRDRNRLKRLFGFDYRIEIYVPARQRQYGYYVCPILEGNRFIGRIDVRRDADNNCLNIRKWWLEPGIRATKGRTSRLQAELNRLARLAEVSRALTLPGVSSSPVKDLN